MPIQVRCPQCQKSLTFPDDKRGKQVRCPDCFQVFLAGKPPAGAAAASAPPEPPPSAPKIAPKAQPAAVRPAPKPAPQKATPAPRPAVRQAPRAAAPPPPRHRSGALGFFIVAFLFLFLMAGGAAAAVGALWYLHVPPFQVASVDTHPAPTNPPETQPPARTEPVKPEKTNPPAPPDKEDPSKSNPPDRPPPDKPVPPPDKPTGGFTRENFDKIDRGMSVEEVSELLGKEPNSSKSVGNPGQLVVTWISDDRRTTIDVSAFDGMVRNKYSAPNWPVVYPGDAPNPRVTQDNFAKIDKGMTTADLVALLGKPSDTQHFTGAPGVKGPDTELMWADGDKQIRARLDHDKVVYKSNLQGWPEDFPSDIGKKPPPEKPTPGVTERNYYRVATGMEHNDLIDLFGQPTLARPGDRPNETIATWVSGSMIVHVTTRDGRVLAKDNNQKWSNLVSPDAADKPAPDKPKPGLTKQNYDKIDTGMREEEVVELLGPISSKGLTPIGTLLTTNDRWKQGDLVIDVSVVNGKVIAKGNFQNWPNIYPSDAGRNPTPPDKPLAVTVTQANFDKIDKGMTAQELFDILGKPSNADKLLAAGGDITATWTAGDGKTTITVALSQGKVTTKANSANWPVVHASDAAKNPPPDKPPPDKPAPPKVSAAVTKENFDKIGKGMSRDELIALFGPPAEVKPQPQPGLDERLIWQGDGVKILVGVTGGKAVTKLSTEDWPVDYPK